jgi:hypothetical protein
MQDIARSTARISLTVAVLVIALGCGRSPTAPLPLPTANTTPTATPTPPTPAPAPGPGLMTYQVSGIVTDDNDSPIANAQLTLLYDNSFKSAKTSTDARGYYSIVFESALRSYDGNADVVGTIFYPGGGEYENYLQAVPWGTAEIVKNLHPRRVRSVNAGQSIVTSIDADSSLAYDGDDWLRMDWVWEKFHVRVADAGTLTVDARPEVGGIVPSLAVYCRSHITDNCLFDWVNAPRGSGTGSLRVQANSVFEMRLAIPSRMAPQRYKVATSLE